MANLRALVLNGATTQRQLDADSVIVGAGITTSTGGLTITSNSGTITVGSGGGSISAQCNLTLNGNQLQNVLIDKLTSDPTLTEARLWYNSTAHIMRFYNGTTTLNVGGDPLLGRTFLLMGS